ncbi:hypothetical protein HK104_000677 [Borealophlyctis nickersoniae]|nr:hypothetical protein HK104_000677 [Borealophlyctis nickersoniae]
MTMTAEPTPSRVSNVCTQNGPTLEFQQYEEEEEDEVVWGKLMPITAGSDMLPQFEFKGDKQEYIIGRVERDCDYIVPGRMVSAQHFKIFLRPDSTPAEPVVMIEDLSTNGTWVGKQRLAKGQRTVLGQSDEICLCPKGRKFTYIFLFKMPAAADAENAARADSEFHRRYDERGELGRGNFSVVRLAVDRETGANYAVKVIDKRRFRDNLKIMQALEREAVILKSLDHPNIVRYHEVFEEANDQTYLVMEMVAGGDFQDYVMKKKRLDEREAQMFFKQMVDVVKSTERVPPDLKPENFLVTKDRVLKLGDFGLAKEAGAVAHNTVCGTPIFLAPEILCQGQNAAYDHRVDLYSLGVILFYMIAGKPPFEEAPPAVVFNKIRQGSVDWTADAWKSASHEVMDLIRRLMAVNPSQRISLREVETHPWMISNIESHPNGMAVDIPTTEDLIMTSIGDGVEFLDESAPWAVLVSENGDGQDLSFSKRTVRIGRREDVNDIVIKNPMISGKHCRFTVEEDGLVLLEDLSANGLRVNGLKLGKGQKVHVDDGAVIALIPVKVEPPALIYRLVRRNPRKRGTTEIEDHSPEAPRKLRRVSSFPTSSPISGPHWRLISLNPDHLTDIERIKEPEMTIGRKPDSDLYFNLIEISSVHCRLKVVSGDNGQQEVVVADCSMNGTWVNGRRIGKGNEAALKDGDELIFLQQGPGGGPLGFICQYVNG